MFLKRKEREELSEHDRMIQARDYADCIMTLEMCYILNKDKPRRALKQCAQRLYERMEAHNVKLIMLTVRRAMCPLGRFTEIKRQITMDVPLMTFCGWGIDAHDHLLEDARLEAMDNEGLPNDYYEQNI